MSSEQRGSGDVMGGGSLMNKLLNIVVWLGIVGYLYWWFPVDITILFCVFGSIVVLLLLAAWMSETWNPSR